jgi:uncharacterized membrane protein YkgB
MITDQYHSLVQSIPRNLTTQVVAMNTQSKKIRSIYFLQCAIGVVYLWFGFLKFFPHLSPAEDLAAETIKILTFGILPKEISLFLLALWEVSVGLLLVVNLYYRITFWLVMVHLVCTFAPLIFLPQISFTNIPYGLTLVGQYIIKNIVIITALLVISKQKN